MAVSMRLRRTGKRKQAYFRIVVADSRSPRDGRFIETLGNYDPNQEPARIEIDAERALHWLKSGARPSDTVRSLLSKEGILARLAEEQPGHAVLKRAQPGKTSRKTREAEAKKQAADEAKKKAEQEAEAAKAGEKEAEAPEAGEKEAEAAEAEEKEAEAAEASEAEQTAGEDAEEETPED